MQNVVHYTSVALINKSANLDLLSFLSYRIPFFFHFLQQKNQLKEKELKILQKSSVIERENTSMWRSQLLEPDPEPLWKWYPGKLPSKHTVQIK